MNLTIKYRKIEKFPKNFNEEIIKNATKNKK